MDAHTRNVFHPCLVLCLVPPTQSFLHILPEFLMYLPFLLHKKYIIATDQYVALLMIFSHMEETSVTESLLSFRAAWSSVSLYPNSFNLHSPIDRHWTLFPNIFYYQQHCIEHPCTCLLVHACKMFLRQRSTEFFDHAHLFVEYC